MEIAPEEPESPEIQKEEAHEVAAEPAPVPTAAAPAPRAPLQDILKQLK